MANPRQRRKAKSGTNKVKQSRRQQDKLRKVVVTGPAALRAEWDIHKTARQNLERLGLASRPLGLRQSGGTEAGADRAINKGKVSLSAESEDDDDSEDEYAMQDDEDDEEENNQTPQAGPSNTTTTTSQNKDIPKGFARLIRDEKGNIIDVIMSAYDEPDERVKPLETDQSANGNGNGESWFEDEDEDDQSSDDHAEEEKDTPWGPAMSNPEHERNLRKAAKPVTAKSAAIRDLEAKTKAEQSIPAESTRFASPAEQAYLRRLVAKHGDDLQAMARDIKLNTDQRTAGQLKKAFARIGGIERFSAA